MGIVVYIIRDEGKVDNRSKISKYFDDKSIQVLIPEIKYEDILTEGKLPQRHEAYQLGWCLTDARKKYGDKSILIVKDSSKCISSNHTVSKILKEIDRDKQFHICYLGKWGDKCHLYSHRKRISSTDYDLVKTSNPQGLQALVISPLGRDIILGIEPMNNGEYFHGRGCIHENLSSYIRKGNITAYCITPNLINYDLSLALKDEDFLKINECEPVVNKNNCRSGINRYVSVIVVIILLVIIIAAAISVYP